MVAVNAVSKLNVFVSSAVIILHLEGQRTQTGMPLLLLLLCDCITNWVIFASSPFPKRFLYHGLI